MARFYELDLISKPDSPFVRDSSNRRVRRSYWLGMDDRTFVLVMTKGIGAHLTNDKKRAHLADGSRAPYPSGLYSGDSAAGIRNAALNFFIGFSYKDL